MRQPGSTSRTVLALTWLVVGAAMVAVTGWIGWTRGRVLLNGHPAAVVLGLATGLLGFVALAWAVASLVIGDRQDREGDPDHPARRTPAQLERRARVRIVLAVPLLLLALLSVVLLGYSRPLAAQPEALAALRSQNGVRTVDRVTWYELVPTLEDARGTTVRPTTGLVFLPGARVDPRAYAPELRRVAEAGYLVVVLKEPFGFSIFDRDHTAAIVENHPEITHWVVGGHSLGGTVAASYADGDRRVEGLLLLASYPSSRLDRTDLRVTSVSGDQDGLATPADIEASKAKLPPSTTYVVVPGAAHASFGDYGRQPHDGTPTADPVAVQEQVAKAAVDLLVAITPKAK
ncbi:alpha/beta hydrolase [Microlunatus flavus]|nr:alpha/beta hydrolase [Microlunatus flavus]